MQVLWDGKDVRVQQSMVYPTPYINRTRTNFVIFPAGSGGELSVFYNFQIESVRIRPLSAGMNWRQDGSLIRIRIDQPVSFSLEVNQDPDKALLVFATAPDILDKTRYEHLVYFGPGEHIADLIHLEQDSTLVYLAEGAKVHGRILAENKKQLAVAGSGIISMENYERHRDDWQLLLDFRHCSDVIIENITATDSCGWSCRIFGCSDVLIRNVKIIGQRGNSDGFDICGSRHVLVEKCFTRVWDDSLVVKAFDTGDAAHIIFRDCVLWNDFARPMEVGVELRADKVHDILFENIDIIRSTTGYPLMGIHHGDRAEVSNIVFQNIRIEDTPGAQIFDIRITDSVWNQDQKKGSIRNVLFRNIDVLENMPISLSPSRLAGFSRDASVQNITLHNIRFQGRAARKAEDLGLLIQDHVSGLQIKADEDPYLEPVLSRLELPQPLVLGPDSYYEGLLLLHLTNTASQSQLARCLYQIAPSGRATVNPGAEEINLEPGSSQVRQIQLKIPPGQFCFHLESPDSHVLPAWHFFSLPLVLPTGLNDAVSYPVTNCRHEMHGCVKLAARNGFLLIESELLQSSQGVVLYAAEPVPARPGEVVFSVEETDQGRAPALVLGPEGPELAPQLRCPAEITYVFKNEPKVKRIVQLPLKDKINPVCFVPFAALGLPADTKSFWLEVEVSADMEKRYPQCLFSSQVPSQISHMFARILLV